MSEAMPPPPGSGGGTPIAPRGVGDIITAAFETYQRAAAKLIPIVAVIVIPLTLVSALILHFAVDNAVDNVTGGITITEDTVTFTSDDLNVGGGLGTLLIAALVGAAIAVIITALLQATITRAAAQAAVGDEPEVEASYKWGLRKVGPVIWISLLVGLCVGVGFLLLIIPGVILMVLFAVTIPALIVEDKRGTDAMKRSWDLVKGNWWHALGVIVVAFLITWVVNMILGLIGGSNWVLGWIMDAIGQIITAPFTALVSVLLYVDLRARAETLSVEALRQQVA